MSYYVFSLRLKCRFFWQKVVGGLYVDAGCTRSFPPGVGNWTGLTAIHLALPATHAAPWFTREYSSYIHMSMVPPKRFDYL
jgi:hypothetical protein